ncbi:MAG: TldD/PmbA family protein [Candidatus Riflebacteria bacterium]|nr:TldD/PmbA family protein [Candidatus Riflebacteria bacterium]
MKDQLLKIVDYARSLGAQYADVRFIHEENEILTVKNGRVEGISKIDDEGFGVRVLIDGAWGFSSGPSLPLWERIVREAVEVARCSGLARKEGGIRFPAASAVTDHYRTPFVEDPFALPLEEKLALMMKADAAARQVPDLKVVRTSLGFLRIDKHFASTEGSYIHQELMESGGGIECTAIGNGEVQKRSYPNSFGRQQLTGGFEHIRAMDLPGHAHRIAEEARALLTAPTCPAGTTTIILDPTQLALQIHESCGHAVELDRALGMEASYAGTSFLTPDKAGRFRYGSDLVNLYQDGTVRNGLGTFGYDDDGMPACRTDIVKNGQFVGYLSNRETAAEIGHATSAANRACSWNRIPIVRMTNVNLAPGTWAFDDLVADTREGLYLVTNKSWSIDDKRLNFQFGTELAYEIKDGKLGRMLKNATYTGITPEFWANCDAICNEKHWGLWGTPNCGKGEPSQIAHVGHGCAPARFRNVRVGVA